MTKKIRLILTIILLIVFGYIIIGEITFPANVPVNGNICDTLPGNNWVRVKEDGTREPFTVPGKTDSDIVLETTLPDPLNKDYSVLCFRGMDMDIYINGELRESYHTTDYKLLGDRSAECYVVASLYPEDAGGVLRVSYDYNFGMVYEVYIGTRIGILTYLFKQFGLELFVGFGLMLLGLICLIAAVIYKYLHNKYLEMEHLSIGVIIGACWVLSNSIFRQLYTRNISVMSDTPFLMVMVMPLPFLVFIDSLQNGRYRKIIGAAGVITVINLIVSAILFVAGIVPLTGSFVSSASCVLISIVAMIITIVLDVSVSSPLMPGII